MLTKGSMAAGILAAALMLGAGVAFAQTYGTSGTSGTSPSASPSSSPMSSPSRTTVVPQGAPSAGRGG